MKGLLNKPMGMDSYKTPAAVGESPWFKWFALFIAFENVWAGLAQWALNKYSLSVQYTKGHLVQVSHFTDGEIEAQRVKWGTISVKEKKRSDWSKCKEIWELGVGKRGLWEGAATYTGYTQRTRDTRRRLAKLMPEECDLKLSWVTSARVKL